MKRFTFDTIHRDSFPKQFLIRHATDKEVEGGDSFESIRDVVNKLSGTFKTDIFLCSTIVSEVLNKLYV